MTPSDTFHAVLQQIFPPTSFMMAYGSGVFQQINHDNRNSMIDFVFAVDDPQKWHTENLIRNPHHYSFLKYFGPKTIANVQEHYGAGIYYNTHVSINSSAFGRRLIKYGIIKSSTLCDDLANWKTLYLSGRMHKPVNILSSNDTINMATSKNLRHALTYALLCLPESFSEKDIYMKIAEISYMGDFRMQFGENPKKVRNIVEGNFKAFQELYKKKIKASPYLSLSINSNAKDDISQGNRYIAGTRNSEVREALISSLPQIIQSNLQKRLRKTDESQLPEMTKKSLRRSVSTIVNRYSRSQSVKGIFTAGLGTSMLYIGQKLQRTYLPKIKLYIRK